MPPVERRTAPMLDGVVATFHEQRINNRELVVSILSYSEKRRRNDLLQMTSWMTQEKELNSEQQRQIIQWVKKGQKQDSFKLKALWTQVANSNNEVY